MYGTDCEFMSIPAASVLFLKGDTLKNTRVNLGKPVFDIGLGKLMTILLNFPSDGLWSVVVNEARTCCCANAVSVIFVVPRGDAHRHHLAMPRTTTPDVPCANPLFLSWVGEWMEKLKERNTKGYQIYKRVSVVLQLPSAKFLE